MIAYYDNDSKQLSFYEWVSNQQIKIAFCLQMHYLYKNFNSY